MWKDISALAQLILTSGYSTFNVFSNLTQQVKRQKIKINEQKQLFPVSINEY